MSAIKHLTTVLALALCGAAFAGEPVNINSAGPESLADAINGVGLKRAQAIVTYREQHGPFRSVEELTAVRGIGAKIVERSRTNLTVDGQAQ